VDLLERETPLAVLADARAAAGAGRGSVVLVAGEAGIGKTSLVATFLAGLPRGARVLLGVSDDLIIPRPFGPFRHLEGAVSRRLLEATDPTTLPSDIVSIVLDELQREPRPTVLVFEDVHWADEGTLDAVTTVSRRVERLPAVLILTYRSGELEDDHPLRAVLGSLPPSATRHVNLAPLSREAVASLAGDAADQVYAASGGNPFFVAQLLAAGPGEVPPSVANAVLAMAARLDEVGRRLVELVSVIPTSADAAVLDAVMPGWASAAEQPERRGLLHVDPGGLRFRHELARAAIRSSMPVVRRRRLHGEILAALRALDADPADIVHHAEAAGQLDVVADYALVAARRAAAAKSNREAFAHYRRAADFAERLEPSERAALLEELATSAYIANHMTAALTAIDGAIRIQAEQGDAVALGRCTRLQSRFQWYAGDGAASLAAARRAVAILEPTGGSAELARAYGELAQLAMLSGRLEETLAWGERSVNMANQFGDPGTRANAMVSIGVARVVTDPDDRAALLEGFALADAIGDWHEATRALLGLSGNDFEWVRPAEARRLSEQAIAYAEQHQVDTLLAYLRAVHAWMLLRDGRWLEAERLAWDEIEREVTVAQLVAKIVLAELALRRGDPDAGERLADVGRQADATRELQHIVPVIELELERALVSGGEMPLGRLEDALALIGPDQQAFGWEVGRLVAWAKVAGMPATLPPRMPAPYAAMASGDWRGAADAFGAVGWAYDRALLLSLLEDEAALTEALAIGRDLGAAPLTRYATIRMRELGHRIPRGPRDSTRGNPGHLTERQLEVLRLMAAGHTNAEIADRLIVSPRTAEHHVGAVLAKLDARTRREALRRARDLGLVTAPSGELGTPARDVLATRSARP
jgi:DNA-binding CsgD family transcriptional regulator